MNNVIIEKNGQQRIIFNNFSDTEIEAVYMALLHLKWDSKQENQNILEIEKEAK